MAVQTEAHILALIQEYQKQIGAFGVQRLGLFGSFVRGQQNEDSEVDLLVEFDLGQKTFDAFIHLAFFLEDLFGRRVELVTPESLSPYLRSHIMSEVEYA